MGSLMLCHHLHSCLDILSPCLGILTRWPWGGFRTGRCFLIGSKAPSSLLHIRVITPFTQFPDCVTPLSPSPLRVLWSACTSYIVPARSELLRHPCILGGPQRQARGQNQKCGSPYPQFKVPHQGVGKKEMTRVGQVQNFRVGSSNHILNSMGRGVHMGGGGGVRSHR